jgi:hypothetical protein
MMSRIEVALLLNAGAEREEEHLSRLLTDGLLRFDDAMNVHITPQGRSHFLALPATKE